MTKYAFTSREDVLAAFTESVKAEALGIAGLLSPIKDRSERLKLYNQSKQGVHPETSKFFEIIYNKETEHIKLVRNVLATIEAFSTDGRQLHDFSKDDLYFFLTSLRFDCGLSDPNIDQLTDQEIQRHYHLEPHHPQYEETNKRECTDLDILEMAIDRLSRNVQANHGTMKAHEMVQYYPTFPQGDSDKKQKAFVEYIETYKELVESEFLKMFGQTKVPELTGEERYHAFIAHSSEDREFCAKLSRDLEDLGFKTFESDRDFVAGHTIIANIAYGLDTSRRVILVVSPNFLDSQWANFETAQAVQKAVDKQRQIIIPILYNTKPDKVPNHIKSINYIEHSRPDFMTKLRISLEGEMPLTSAIPAGNVAHGLAWSYFFGFLRLVLPGMQERVEQSKFYNQSIPILNKMLIILPESCFCPGNLKDVDPERLSFQGNVEFEADRAGNVKRNYKSPVYKIKDPETSKEYYCIVEFATPLMSLYEMELSTIAGLSSQDKKNQRMRFQEYLDEILTHPNNAGCHRKAICIPYRDPKSAEPESLPALLSRRVKAEMEKENDIKKLRGDLSLVEEIKKLPEPC